MRFRKLLLASLFICPGLQATEKEYTTGVFILNEDRFGHNNSTINHLNPETGEFDYYIIRENADNNGLTLGCTAQFGAIYGDNIYIISKQDQDGGESKDKQGGRVVVADAKTMKIKKSIKIIAGNNGNSIADGRSFVGVNENKAYIGTANGIYLFNLQDFEIGNRIEGTENPLITGEEQNDDGLGPLYQNQIGMMIRTHDYVFAIQQDKGILVIDPKTDKIVQIITGCFSTMTQSKDGNLWVGRNSNVDYQHYPYGDFGSTGEKWIGNELLKINPGTLETEAIPVTLGGINQTWYAWTAGSLCAGTHENVLYFTFNSDKWSWFTTSEMYKYDIDNESFTLIYETSNEKRYFYGAAIRVNPLTDELYAILYKSNTGQDYWFYRLDNAGTKLQAYEPILRYWFSSLFIFPDIYAPEVRDLEPAHLIYSNPLKIELSNLATDKDNRDAAIIKSIADIKNPNLVSAAISNNTLTLTALKNTTDNTEVTIRFNSNGKTVDKKLAISLTTVSSIDDSTIGNIKITIRDGNILISGIAQPSFVEVFTLHGQPVLAEMIDSDYTLSGLNSKQVYILKINNNRYKIIL